jgi:predicted esterase
MAHRWPWGAAFSPAIQRSIFFTVAAVTCPVLFVLGESDQMTPPRAAKSLIDQVQAHGQTCHVVKVPMGHHHMSESPEETLNALKVFLKT